MAELIIMSLNLYMVGVIVNDIEKSIEFYRRLGVKVPEKHERPNFAQIQMGDMTFFLSQRDQNKTWDPNNTVVSDEGYRIILEFYLKTQEAVEKKYQELLNYGYESHLEPYITPFNMYFAIIKDPDGNQILISGEVKEKN